MCIVFEEPLMWIRSSIAAIVFACCGSLPVEAQMPCSPDLWKSPAKESGAGIRALLKDLPIETKWAAVPEATRATLRQLADKRLAAYRAHWNTQALTTKLRILNECPTPEMIASINNFYRKTYDTTVPPTFTLESLKSGSLAQTLVRHYLGSIAASRASTTYPEGKLPNRDWDGISLFDSTRLPDALANTDVGKFNALVVGELRRLDESTLTELEKSLRRRVLFDARANASGVFNGVDYGDVAADEVCGLIARDWDILAGYQRDNWRPLIFATDDDVLGEANAIYLHNTKLRRVDVGTIASALGYCNATRQDFVKERVSDPTVAKGLILLKNWWIERVTAGAEAKTNCTIYSASDRTAVWETFSAAQLFNNDGSSSMDTYVTLLSRHVERKRTQYRGVAKSALRLIFPGDSVLTLSQRQQIEAMIDAEAVFGLFPNKIAIALDSVNAVAAQSWRASISTKVTALGGYSGDEPVRPEDEAAIRAMFEEVKAWLGARYKGYPIDIASLYSKIPLEVNTEHNVFTMSGGKIKIGVGTKRGRVEYYSWLIHELRHAVYFAREASAADPSDVKTDEGPVLEGSGVAAEELLLPLFLKETLNDDIAVALYMLDFGLRDARFAATTDAALQIRYRTDCSDLDSVEFAKKIAHSYGLTDKLADNLAIRAHAGVQYFQYIWGGLQVLDDIAYLQKEIDDSGQRLVDPFVLFACGLNSPQRDETYVNALKTCVRSKA